jgi:protease-4
MEFGDVSGLLEKLGIKADQLVSGPLKGQPSFTEPLSAPGRQYLQALVADLYDQFVQIVVTGRHMDADRVRSLADGRAYSGRQALANGLVDEIGGEREAIAWLEKKRHVTSGLPVDDVVKGTWTQRMMQGSMEALIVSARQALRVDGVLALWQPSITRE